MTAKCRQVPFILWVSYIILITEVYLSEGYSKLVLCNQAMPVCGHGGITVPGSATVRLRSGSITFACGSSIPANANLTTLDAGTSGISILFARLTFHKGSTGIVQADTFTK